MFRSIADSVTLSFFSALFNLSVILLRQLKRA
jgi:hypothetical protein